MPQQTIDVKVDQGKSWTVAVGHKNPRRVPFDPNSGRSIHDQLRDLLWSGEWKNSDARVIVWDDGNQEWLMWEA